MPLEAADKCMSVQQVKHHYDSFDAAWYSFVGFHEDSGWPTLDSKWCAEGKKVECWTTLHLSHSVNLDIKPGLVTEVLRALQMPVLLSSPYILGAGICLIPCPLSLCIHGNRCFLGQLLAIKQFLSWHVSDHNHCKVHTTIFDMHIALRVLGSILIEINTFCNECSFGKSIHVESLMVCCGWL